LPLSLFLLEQRCELGVRLWRAAPSAPERRAACTARTPPGGPSTKCTLEVAQSCARSNRESCSPNDAQCASMYRANQCSCASTKWCVRDQGNSYCTHRQSKQSGPRLTFTPNLLLCTHRVVHRRSRSDGHKTEHTTPHNTTQHNTTQHSTTPRHTTPHHDTQHTTPHRRDSVCITNNHIEHTLHWTYAASQPLYLAPSSASCAPRPPLSSSPQP
jgi:hypothetical protein